MVKVACIGNMNNIFFSLVRHLRDREIEADVLLLNTEMWHFHPSSDSYDLNYQKYTRSLSWGSPLDFTKTSKRQILEDLKKYDMIIGCGSTPAFMNKIGRRLDLFIPYGDDIVSYAFFNFKKPLYKCVYQLVCASFIKSQKTGIRKAAYLNIDPTNDEMEKVISQLNYTGKRLNCGIPMIYTPIYHPDRLPQFYDRSHWFREFEGIRQKHQLMLFHHARHVWKNSPDRFTWKANDKLFRGFADFVKQNSSVSACIVSFEYGSDVNETKRLVHELGIEGQVFWFPQMMRKDIMVGLNLSDIGTGEFHMSWLSCGTIYETLAMAKPLMHYREDRLYKHHYSELYPMIHIKTPEDVAGALHDYLKRPDYYKEMGEKGREWLQQYAIDYPLNEYMKIIEGYK